MGRWYVLVLLFLPGCQATKNFFEPAKDALAPAIGAGIGALFAPYVAVIGAFLGAIYSDAVEYVELQEEAKKVIINEVLLPPTAGALLDEWKTVLLVCLLVSFLVGWILNKPSDMLKRTK